MKDCREEGSYCVAWKGLTGLVKVTLDHLKNAGEWRDDGATDEKKAIV